MQTVRLSSDGRNRRVGEEIIIGHHSVRLDRGLQPGEMVRALFLDDAAWQLEVDAIEFAVDDTLYRMRLVWPTWAGHSPIPAHGAITTRQTEHLLRLLGLQQHSRSAAGVGEGR